MPREDMAARRNSREALNIKTYDITEDVAVDAHEQLADDLVLNRTYFTSYVSFWEKLGDKTANAKFDKLLEDQRRLHRTESEDRVSYPDVQRVRTRQGHETRKGIHIKTELEKRVLSNSKH